MPKLALNDTKILLYADDTSIIVTSPNLDMLQEQSDKIFQDVSNWFKMNQLSLNYKKTQYLQFKTQNSIDYQIRLNFMDNC